MAKTITDIWAPHFAQTVSVRRANSDTLIARVFGARARAEAYARLIAVAPEMYTKLDDLQTALEETIKYLDLAEVDILIFKQAIKDIESLLAKARGEQEAQHG